MFVAHRQVDGVLQQLGKFVFTDALPPACEARGVNGQAMLHVRVTAKILPVRILNPTLDDGFVRRIESMFEIVQPDHQPRGQCGRTVVRAVEFADAFLKMFPVELLRQFDQRMRRIEQLIKVSLKEQ